MIYEIIRREGELIMPYTVAIPVSTETRGNYRKGREISYTGHDQKGDYHLAQIKQDAAFRAEFRRLADEWLQDIRDISSLSLITSHSSYLQIIGKGQQFLPYIFAELQRAPNHWFAALRAITGSDPVLPSQRGDLLQMTQVWLDWAEKRNYA